MLLCITVVADELHISVRSVCLHQLEQYILVVHFFCVYNMVHMLRLFFVILLVKLLHTLGLADCEFLDINLDFDTSTYVPGSASP